MRVSPKLVADVVTGSRAVVALGVLGAAWYGAPSTLPWVVGIVVLAWTGDMVDGWLARKGGRSPLAWVGRHDHEIDASLAGATLIYLWRVGLVPVWMLGLLLLVTFVVWYKLRSEWVWMSFNTGSHLVALTALFSAFPPLAGIAVGWGAMVALAGRQRTTEMLGDVRLRLNRLLHRLT